MDDDYGAAGKGRILRHASRRARASYIRDRGAKGRWQTVHRSPGIGPLKKGELTSLGYSHTKSTTQRHEALAKAVSKYGRTTTIRKLNAIAVYSKRTAPGRSKTYKRDMRYVQKKFA